MFALLETETVPRQRFFERLRCRLHRETGVSLFEENRWGIHVLRVLVTHELGDKPSAAEKRAALAFSEIARRGVRVLVLPRNYPFLPDPSYGLITANPLSLYRRIAPALFRFAADALRRAPRSLSLVICAGHVTQELINTIQALIMSARVIALCIPRDITELSSSLRAQYGVSVIENPSPSQLGDADIYLMFEKRDISPKPGCAVIWLNGSTEASCPGRHCNGAEIKYPPGIEPAGDADPDAVLTALSACGAVNPLELTVRNLLWNGEAVEF